MRNSLHHLGIGRVWIKSHPLNAARTGFKSSYMNMKAGYMNLIRTWCLSGNPNVVIAPAVPRGRSRGFVALPRISRQTEASCNGSILEPPDVISTVNCRNIPISLKTPRIQQRRRPAHSALPPLPAGGVHAATASLRAGIRWQISLAKGGTRSVSPTLLNAAVWLRVWGEWAARAPACSPFLREERPRRQEPKFSAKAG